MSKPVPSASFDPHHAVDFIGGSSALASGRAAPRLTPEFFTPQDDGEGVNPHGAVLTLAFNEAVKRGSGVIYVTDGMAQTVIDRVTGQPAMRIVGATDTRAISISDTSLVQIVDGRVTIHVGDLQGDTSYSVLMGKGVLTDLDGRAFAGIASSSTFDFSTGSAPTASIAIDRTTLGAADSMTVTVTFSEAVQTIGATDFEVGGGTLGAFTANPERTVWTASFTPFGEENSSGNRITLAADAFRDLAGNYGSAAASSAPFTVDTIAPELTSADHLNSVAVATPLVLTFSEPMYWADGATLNLTHGSESTPIGAGQVMFSSDRMTLTIPAAAHQMAVDQNYLLDLAAALRDAAGNPIADVLAVDTFGGDNDPPAAPSIDLDAASDHGASNSDNVTTAGSLTIRGEGEPGASIEVRDQAGDTLIGTATVNGSGNWTLTTSYTAGAYELVARQTDPAGNVSEASAPLAITVEPPSGVPTPNAPALVLASDTGNAYDHLTTDLTPSFWVTGTPVYGTIKLYDNGAHVGDFPINPIGTTQVTAPTLALGSHALTIVVVDEGGAYSAPSAPTTVTLTDALVEIDATSLHAGDTATITLHFAKPVPSLDSTAFNVANGGLDGFTSSNGGLTWTATFTPLDAVNDATNVVELIGSAVTFSDSSHGASASYVSRNFAINTDEQVEYFYFTPPIAYAGSEVDIYFGFHKDVAEMDPSAFTVAGGTLSNFRANEGGWIATFTPTVSGTLLEDNVITIDMSKIVYTDASHGSGVYTSHDYVVDTRVTAWVNDDITISDDDGMFDDDLVTGSAAQTISGTYSGTLEGTQKIYLLVNGEQVDPGAIVLDTVNRTWSYSIDAPEGEVDVLAMVRDDLFVHSAASVLEFEVDLSGPAPVDGNVIAGVDPDADLEIQFDDALFWSDASVLTIAGGSGSVTLTKDEVTIDGDTMWIAAAKHGMVVGDEYTVTLPSGLTDDVGNAGGSFVLRTEPDEEEPVADKLVVTSPNGTYKVGDTITFELHFNEAVKADEDAWFDLETGEYDGVARYAAGDGTSILTFEYTVEEDEATDNLTVDSFNGLSYYVRDLAGNYVTGPHNFEFSGMVDAGGEEPAIVIDGVLPHVVDDSVSLENKVVITFNEEIKFDSGSFYVFDEADELVHVYTAGDGDVRVLADGGGLFTILELEPMFGEGDYTVGWSEDALTDLAGNEPLDFVGFSYVPVTA